MSGSTRSTGCQSLSSVQRLALKNAMKNRNPRKLRKKRRCWLFVLNVCGATPTRTSPTDSSYFFAFDPPIISSVRPNFINNQLFLDEFVNDFIDQMLTFESYFWRTAVSVSKAKFDEEAAGEVHWHPNPQHPDEKNKKLFLMGFKP